MTSRRTSTPQHGLVVFAKNKRRVSAFYQATLSLSIVESEPSHDLLQGHGLELVIHAIPRKYAASIKLTRPPEPREDTAFKPVFVVEDLDATRVAARSAGGRLKPADLAWRFRGFIVLDGWDPEGNIIQFRQRSQDGQPRIRPAVAVKRSRA